MTLRKARKQQLLCKNEDVARRTHSTVRHKDGQLRCIACQISADRDTRQRWPPEPRVPD